mmetsp:Transcript_166166/g.533371  ORF Transcript_166166/g.533371 Transcript_166166/m.533371 type:complete len:1213 (-) Transcript_166166:114-3752(-)
MAAEASAFDLLRGTQRRARQAPPASSGDGAPKDELLAATPEGGAVDWSLQAPLRPGSATADERVGLWWAVRGGHVLYWPLSGPAGAPSFVHTLPQDVVAPSARCVAVLTGPGPSAPPGRAGAVGGGEGAAGARRDGPCSVVVGADFQVVVFPQGERCSLPRLAGAPLGQSPAFVVAAPAPRGASGVALVVGTTAGRLLTVALKQSGGDSFSAEAGPLWPTTRSAGGLKLFLNRVLGSSEDQAPTAPPARAVELLPAPAGSGALFAALVLGEGDVALYAHPQSMAAPELLWVASLASLLGMGAVARPRLLAAKHYCEEPTGLLVLFATAEASGEEEPPDGEAEGSSPRCTTSLARLSWTPQFWREPPRLTAPEAGIVGLGPAPSASLLRPWGCAAGEESAFLAAAGRMAVVAVRASEQKFTLCTVSLTPSGLVVARSQPLQAGLLGLALVSEGASSGRVAALTPHGLLECPTQAGEGVPELEVEHEDEDMGAADVGAHGLLRGAYDLYAGGQEERSADVASRAFERFGAAGVLTGVERCTMELLDAPGLTGARWRGVDDSVATRHLLFDKAGDLQQWLGFLSACGIWTRLGGLPGTVRAQQKACEACERVAAASRLRELDDCAPKVFEAAIRRTLQEAEAAAGTGGAAKNGDDPSEARRYYGSVGSCERLLASLVDYPRSLPLGSCDVTDAVLFANAAVAAFLEAALERRSQVISAFPALLPPPKPASKPRCLSVSSPPPRAIGSDWLLSPVVLGALDQLRRANLEVIPAASMTQGLPLLDAQALRILESLHDLCRTTLRVGYASTGDLHVDSMAALRRPVLQHLAMAEETALGQSRGAQRALSLAEQFEDIEAVVALAAKDDMARLDEHLRSSPTFCTEALMYFLRVAELRPLFFRAVRLLEIPRAQVDDLLRPYPELLWILHVHSLGQDAPRPDWDRVLSKVNNQAVAAAHGERHSSAKRDAFAALAAIAQRAGAAQTCSRSADVAESACLGRLQRVCLRFSAQETATSSASGGCKRSSPPDQPPASAEEILRRLAGCIRTALPVVHAEGADGRLCIDAAQLVRLVERGLEEARVDVAHFLGTRANALEETPAGVIGALQLLWAEVALAEEASWREVLDAHEGISRDALVSSLGFARMARWSEEESEAPPRSVALEPLCEAFPDLRPLAPALRLSVGRGSSSAMQPAGGCGAQAASVGNLLFAAPAAAAFR